MGVACDRYGGRRGVYRILVGKPEGKGTFERPWRRWEDHTKMDLQEMECGNVGAWTGLIWLRIRTRGGYL